MGEKSKTIGEIGENIAQNFFALLGWHELLPGQSLTCAKKQKHASKESKKGLRETHGIDYLFSGVVAQMPVAAEVGSGDERDELGSG